jgi:anti-sigma regulatory factor (Ser/Thr protein kinase)
VVSNLQSALRKPPFTEPPLEVHTWLRSDIGLISLFVDWLISLLAESRCVLGKEEFVELTIREAMSNAMLHGNRMDAQKLVHVRCCSEGTRGVFIVIRDQGSGFDPNTVSDSLAVENLDAEHGRGIHLMKLAMDDVSFERGGTAVHTRKDTGNKPKTPGQRIQKHRTPASSKTLARRPLSRSRVHNALQVKDRALSKRERGRSRSPHREPIGPPPRARVDRTLMEREGNDPAASPCLKATDYARSPRTSRAAPRVAVCAERPSSPELAAEHTHGDSEVESMRCYREIALDRCPAQSVRHCNRRQRR